MASKPKRKQRPLTVAEAEAQLARARRREEPPPRHRVDLATLDTPDVTHADQWADFLNRPGQFYVGTFDIALDEDPLGEKLTTRTTFKADTDQLLYLVEVLRQIRGAFGVHTRITLTPAEPHVEQRRLAGPATRHHDIDHLIERSSLGTPVGERPATADELAAVREMRRRAESMPDRASWRPGVGSEDGSPWEPPAQDYTREELAAMLPGQTRGEVAAELGRTPEDIGGTVHHADVMPEQMAADLGVPVESLRRIPIRGGGYAWTVTAGPVEDRGRHAAPDAD